MPIGTIVASVRMASIARPSFGVWSSAVGLRVPSGKTTRTWPASRTRWARRNASMSALARSTGTTPPLRAIQPTIGQSNISFLPSQWIRRPSRGVSHAPRITGSAFEMWLAARITGPDVGIAAVGPSTRTRVVERARMRAPSAVPRISGVRSSRSSSDSSIAGLADGRSATGVVIGPPPRPAPPTMRRPP